MVELKQTKLSDRSTVGRVWDSEFEGYRIDSRNRQIFATSENSKIYFSNIIQIICYLETLICLIIFVNNIDLLQVVLIYSLMSLNVLILRSKNSLQTDCIISRFEYTVSLWWPDQDIRNYYPKILNYFGIIIINWTKEGVPPQLTRRRAPTRASPPQLTRRRATTRAPPPQLTRRRRCPPTTHTETRVFTRHPHTDEGVPPAIHAKTKVFPSPLTHRRGCSPRHSHTDEGCSPAPHMQTTVPLYPPTRPTDPKKEVTQIRGN